LQLVQSSRNEYLKLKARVDNLQRTQRQVDLLLSRIFITKGISFSYPTDIN